MSLFGVVMAVNTLLFMVLHAYILRNLMKPDLIGDQDPHLIWKSFVGPLSYLLGAAAAWVRVPAAFLLYMLTPLFFIVPPGARRAGESGAAQEASLADRR